MAEHTPGTWRYTCRGKVGEFAVYTYVNGEQKAVPIAHLGLDTPGENVGGGEREANARLIAAAPSLLEACKAAKARMLNGGNNADTLAQVRAAIAMAQPQKEATRHATTTD